MFSIGAHAVIVKSSQLHSEQWFPAKAQMRWNEKPTLSLLVCLHFSFLSPAFNDEILKYFYPLGCVYLEGEEGSCAFACAAAPVS